MTTPNNGSPVAVNKWLVTFAVMAGTFMEIVDTTVVNVALPHIAGSLAASEDETTWILTAYLVSNAIILPITGWLSALFGRKRFLLLCMALFTVSSMLCGMATSLGMLIVFRIIQGVGGGALQPISQAILLETFPVAERGMAMAIWGIGVIIAPIVGPVMGGWVTDNLTWRWAFYINLPIGLLSLILTWLFIFDPDYIRRQRAGSIDYWGLGLLVVGLGALQVVLDKGERDDWFSSAFITRLAIIAVVALGVLIYHELKTRHPVVDLRLFKERNYAAGVTIMFFFGFVLYGSIMLLPLFLQTLMGYDATLSGWALAFGGIGSLMIMPVVGRLTMVMDSRKIVFVGLLINAYAVYLMSGYTTDIDFYHAWWPRFVQGFGLGATFVSLTTLTMSRISQEKMGNATGIFNLMRNLGGPSASPRPPPSWPGGASSIRVAWWSTSPPCPSRSTTGSSACRKPCRIWGPTGSGGMPPRPWPGFIRKCCARPKCWPSATITGSSPSSFSACCPWSFSCAAAPSLPS